MWLDDGTERRRRVVMMTAMFVLRWVNSVYDKSQVYSITILILACY